MPHLRQFGGEEEAAGGEFAGGKICVDVCPERDAGLFEPTSNHFLERWPALMGVRLPIRQDREPVDSKPEHRIILRVHSTAT